MTQDHLIKGLTVLTWLIILGFLVNLGLYSYFQTFYNTPSVTWSTQPFPVVQPVVNQGETLSFSVLRCAKKEYAAKVNREIIDGLAYVIPEVTIIFKKGCVNETRIIPEVTKNLPAGEYYLRSHVEVTERWLWFSRTDSFETRTEKFTVKVPRLDGEGESVER